MTETPANHPAPTTSGGWCAPIELPHDDLVAEADLRDPTPDLPRLRKVLDHIDAYPEQHDQRWWVARHTHTIEGRTEITGLIRSSRVDCGTTRCLAGWVEFLEDGVTSADHAETRARELLGLTAPEAHALFFDTAASTHQDDQRAAIQRVAKKIAERAGERL